MNLLGISEGPALGHHPERFKRRFVTRNRPPALQFLDIAAYLADILMQRATLMLIDAGFVADRRFLPRSQVRDRLCEFWRRGVLGL